MMSIERRLAHASFTLTRDYPAPVAHVWRAFAEEERKRQWFGDGETFDGTHMSTSIASFQFEPIADGTRLTQVEHGVFFDAFHADIVQREEGMRGLLEAIANHVQ
jgi:hypothetical protein